jgi:hypothetical protein
MFKGSKNVGPEEHSRLVEAIGGNYNANTFFDRTLYYQTVPSNAIDRECFFSKPTHAKPASGRRGNTSAPSVTW